MSEFRLKNLMIDVLDRSVRDKFPDLCLFPTRYCRFFISRCIQPTFIACRFDTIDCLITNHCLLTNGGCGVNYSTCYQTDLFIIDLKTLVINPADIRVVQQQLKEVFSAVEERAAEVQHNMAPQSIEQINVLEDQLKGALDELANLKKQMGGK